MTGTSGTSLQEGMNWRRQPGCGQQHLSETKDTCVLLEMLAVDKITYIVGISTPLRPHNVVHALSPRNMRVALLESSENRTAALTVLSGQVV